ncbi:MAG TPA: hypothetical protein VNO21_12495, partial [Polyangiaceae bacterium]|nr:hypothetical protein [Polyangiaceae bacterium]
VDVTVDGNVYSVGCRVGIDPSEQGSARASGAMTAYGGGPIAWWEDASDSGNLPSGTEDDVLEALNEAAGRLWLEVEALREKNSSEG